MPPRTLDRTRAALADFLRQRRECISPAQAGLPSAGRRRTPGLRREEVAALAGVGLTWYTWLEQGREIGVSAAFLENLARVLRLDAAERRHLFLLAHQRPPAESGRTWCTVPPLVRRLMDDLPLRPAYVLNLRWDVLAWNAAAERVFGFGACAPGHRNMLRMIFLDPAMRERFAGWEAQAPQMLASFRRDLARAPDDPTLLELVDELERAAPDFRQWWRQHDVQGVCSGIRALWLDAVGTVRCEHATLTADEERHLRLVVYAAVAGEPGSEAFEAWLASGIGSGACAPAVY
ncbi:helix-turn-helix transcriptional regulator [Cupriavidus sp. YAF13]|uniref:helix-turn-helix transcriptional regulator n=1 Tax=Cupriavidus sp. YAF13 TaxID=3233075 RepID=UPI003F92B870